MVIHVLDQNYFVLQTLPSETGLTQYVCRNVAGDDGHIYRVVMVPREETTPDLVRWLSDIFSAGRFHELVQYASERDSLQIVVDCGFSDAVPMDRLLSEEQPALKERMMMCGKMLERLILSDVPAFFAVPALYPDHVRFTKGLDCCFTYELENLVKFEETDTEKELHHLRAVIRKLFAAEMRDRKLPELKSLLDRIVQHEFPDRMAIYEAWLPIQEKYGTADETKLEAKSLPYIIWEKIKVIAGFLKKLFFIVVIIMALAYLVLSIRNFAAPQKQQDIYQSIGDMTIQSGTAAETEEQDE